MNKDTELFELCKEVYRRTKWTTPQLLIKWFDEDCPMTPIYTSDYLLENLPDWGLSRHMSLTLDHDSWDDEGLNWAAYYSSNDDNSIDAKLYASARTPLKALLKLTIALHEAGELS